ncbi:hypothetical protein FHETE_2543 [Fusarium heterosporum]|uniref:Reverse transcriptase domain-containing protein n=1 Tax=Fusarium heterosporum TaxID=42747 RepID=A0A8H5TSZ7_FUSHE|nr:hypothetical protein FHETE_2543 [Fusarium heterosporum]
MDFEDENEGGHDEDEDIGEDKDAVNEDSGAPLRVDALQAAIKKVVDESRDDAPMVIAAQDPATSQAYKGMPGYDCWYSSTKMFTKEHYIAWHDARTGGSSRSKKTTQPRQPPSPNHAQTHDNPALTPTSASHPSAQADAPADALDGSPTGKYEPQIHSVLFYIHSRIPKSSWRVRPAIGLNEGLFATLELMTAIGPLAIHNVYNRTEKLNNDELFTGIGNIHHDTVLLGDFNYHHNKWTGIFPEPRETTASRDFLSQTVSNGQVLMTKRGTCTWSNDAKKTKWITLDLVFVSDRIQSSVEYCKVLPAAGFESDHRIIQTKLVRDLKLEVKMKPYWDRVDKKKFLSELVRLLPPKNHSLGTRQHIDEYMSKVTQALVQTIKLCVPMVEVGYQRKRLQHLERRLEKTRSRIVCLQGLPSSPKVEQELKQRWRHMRAFKQEMWQLFTENESNTSEKAFRLANLGRQICQPIEPCQLPTLKHNGTCASTDEEKIELFKKVIFRANDSPTSTEVPEKPTRRHYRDEISIPQDLDDAELEKLVKWLPKRKSCGTDGIASEAIKLGDEPLRFHLLRAFKGCLRISYHPVHFKDSIIVMVRKAGRSPDDPKGWRPISLISCMDKLLERIVATRMMDALRANCRLLPAHQFGMRTTTEALQYLFETIYGSWFKGKYVTILGLDISGAYDSVLRALLLQELDDKGFPPWVTEFIRSFLSHRTAVFRLPGLTSSPFKLNTGVPQGSPLSPILFIIFAAGLLQHAKTYKKHKVNVNGTNHGVDLHPFSFVDDVYLIAASNNYEANCRGLEMLHESVQVSAKDLDIEFGPAKYHLMHCKKPRNTKGHNNVVPNIPGFTKAPEAELTILGVKVTFDLNWKAHIDYLIAKVKRRMGYLSLISGATWGPPLAAMRRFYVTKIRSVMTYACGAWLESLQSLCLRKISGAFGNTPAEVLEKELQIENIWTVLHTQATVQRAKSLLSADQRWRPIRITYRYPKTKPIRVIHVKARRVEARNPYIDLDLEASCVVVHALNAIVARHRDKSGEWERTWADSKKRGKVIGNWMKHWATEDCRVRWESYVTRRTIDRALASSDSTCGKLPVAFTEVWGPKSVGYYSGMNRAQSTMLLHCRTGDIGLNCHLYKIGIRNDNVTSPYCACNSGAQTPFHLFVQCPRLIDARKHLLRKVGHTRYQDLLTDNAVIAANWALKYFDIEQFDKARPKVQDFPTIEGIIPPRPHDEDSNGDVHEDPHARFPHDPNETISHMPKRTARSFPLLGVTQSSDAVPSQLGRGGNGGSAQQSQSSQLPPGQGAHYAIFEMPGAFLSRPIPPLEWHGGPFYSSHLILTFQPFLRPRVIAENLQLTHTSKQSNFSSYVNRLGPHDLCLTKQPSSHHTTTPTTAPQASPKPSSKQSNPSLLLFISDFLPQVQQGLDPQPVIPQLLEALFPIVVQSLDHAIDLLLLLPGYAFDPSRDRDVPRGL